MDDKPRDFTTGGHDLLTGLGDISGVGNVSYQFGLSEDESILVTSSEDITNGVNLGLKYRYAFTETLFSEWNNTIVNRCNCWNGQYHRNRTMVGL